VGNKVLNSLWAVFRVQFQMYLSHSCVENYLVCLNLSRSSLGAIDNILVIFSYSLIEDITTKLLSNYYRSLGLLFLHIKRFSLSEQVESVFLIRRANESGVNFNHLRSLSTESNCSFGLLLALLRLTLVEANL
jgi:hypothetical protein